MNRFNKQKERDREPFRKSTYRNAVIAYKMQLKAVSDEIERGLEFIYEPTEEAYMRVFESAAENMPSKPIENMIRATYLKTGVWFANNEYEKHVGEKGFKKKDFLDVEQLWEGYFESFLKSARMTELIKDVTLSSVKRLKRISKTVILDTLQKGLSIRETSKRILAGVGKEWNRTNRYYASRIARTEVLTASNAGSRQGALSTGLKMTHSWIDTKDGRERESHILAGVDKNNKNIPLEQDYTVGGEKASFPGDPKLSGEERIQCRCAERFSVVR